MGYDACSVVEKIGNSWLCRHMCRSSAEKTALLHVTLAPADSSWED